MTRNRHETDLTLFAFSDESLSPPDISRVMAHISSCSLCNAQVSRYRRLRDLVAVPDVSSNAGWTVREVAEAAGHGLRALEGTPTDSPERRMNPGISLGGILKHRVTGMAAALLLGGAAGYWISGGGSGIPNPTEIVLRGPLILGPHGLSIELRIIALITVLILTSIFPRELSGRERVLPLILWSFPLGDLLLSVFVFVIGVRAMEPWPPTTAPGSPLIFLYIPMCIGMALQIAFLGFSIGMAVGKDRVRKLHGWCAILYFAVFLGYSYFRLVLRFL